MSYSQCNKGNSGPKHQPVTTPISVLYYYENVTAHRMQSNLKGLSSVGTMLKYVVKYPSAPLYQH